MLSLPNLTILRSDAEALINVQIDKGNRLFNYDPSDEGLESARSEFVQWDEYNKKLLLEMFDSPAVSEEYASSFRGKFLTGGSLLEKFGNYEEHLTEKIRLLETFKGRLPQYKEPVQTKADSIDDYIRAVERICTRFHAVARQLRERHEDRETLNVADEYDVQDLLHALLRIYFDDIRPEEWTPSAAGGASRVDFPAWSSLL